CAPDERHILIVTDTSGGSLEENGILPTGSATIMPALAEIWFADYRRHVFDHRDSLAIPRAMLDCASAVVWLTTGSGVEGDNTYVQITRGRGGDLDGYVSAGGHLLFLGTSPTASAAYQITRRGNARPVQFPVILAEEAPDSNYLTHWMRTALGVGRVERTVGNTFGSGSAADRLTVARAAVPGYPDLAFDRLTWPSGPAQRGFGFYDEGVEPVPGRAEVIYTRDDTGQSLGVRTLDGRGVFLGFHPYFVERGAFQELIHAVMADFGVARVR
ncbi:MAG: hypothetical protein HKN12_02235, partial [Gemmatimonadetes bacterium]|nr:hypothetical protein [Gemmatimonadota bacterium]